MWIFGFFAYYSVSGGSAGVPPALLLALVRIFGGRCRDFSAAGARRPRDSRRGRRRYGGIFHSWRDYYFLRHFFVYGLDVVMAASVVENAYYRWMRPRQGTQDAAFSSAVGADGGDFHQYAVAVHGGSDGVWCNENVASEASFETFVERRGFGDHEAKAVAMHGEAAD